MIEIRACVKETDADDRTYGEGDEGKERPAGQRSVRTEIQCKQIDYNEIRYVALSGTQELHSAFSVRGIFL